MPLAWHVGYSSNPKRLARVQGSLTHVQNIPYDAYRYFLSLDVRPARRFPFVRRYGSATLGIFGVNMVPPAPDWTRVDLVEFGVTLVGMQPALLALALAGLMVLLYTPSRGLWAMAVATLLPVGIMLMYSALSCRFKQDALCGLLFWGAVSTTAARPHRWYLTAVLLSLGAYSVLMNLGAALLYQGEIVWGVPNYARDNYVWLKSLLAW